MADTQTAEQTTQTAVNDSEYEKTLMIATLLCFLLSDSETVERTITVNDSKEAELYKFLFFCSMFVVDLFCLLFLVHCFHVSPFLFLICFVVNLLSWTTSPYTQIADKPVVESSPN